MRSTRRFDYGEERSNIIGMVEVRLLFVAYTLRGGRIHINLGAKSRVTRKAQVS